MLLEQVRAQEMFFASKRIAEFRHRKTKDSKMLINHLKVSIDDSLPYDSHVSISFSKLAWTFDIC